MTEQVGFAGKPRGEPRFRALLGKGTSPRIAPTAMGSDPLFDHIELLQISLFELLEIRQYSLGSSPSLPPGEDSPTPCAISGTVCSRGPKSGFPPLVVYGRIEHMNQIMNLVAGWSRYTEER
jgi:hypothetical protein